VTDEACPFCRLVDERARTHAVYEDDRTLAFMDVRPINPGHVLVIPKRHVPDFYRLEDADYGSLMAAVKRVAAAVETLTRPRKVGLVVAGFDVPHAHVHVVPMHHYHDITSRAYSSGGPAAPAEEELAREAAELRAVLADHEK
jgi:histidine triad (HIT) family protein